MQKLILFDIDGTILLTYGAGRRAVREAVFRAIGIADMDQAVRFDGKTDPQIIREMLIAADHPHASDDSAVWAICHDYVSHLETELKRAGTRVELMTGILPLLDKVEADSRAVMGLLTGNMERGAHLKLSHAGIEPTRFRVGAFGSDAPNRDALPPFATSRAAAIFGREPTGSDVVIIGDTPNDMTCGNGVGARAIGVTTGNYGAQELEEAGAYRVFTDLADHQAVLTAIFE